MDSFNMGDNFNDFTTRSSSSTAIPACCAPSCNILRSLENAGSRFNDDGALWAEMGKMRSWRSTIESNFASMERLIEAQASTIDTIKKRNTELKQEVQELKHQVAKSMAKKTHSLQDRFLSVRNVLNEDKIKIFFISIKIKIILKIYKISKKLQIIKILK